MRYHDNIETPQNPAKSPTSNQPSHVHRLRCLVCRSRFIGEHLLAPLRCPSCGYNALALIEELSLDDPWWHLLPFQAEVV
jgi:DNA-directed RNA polymerase subunit RPC12/RpoP